MQWQKYMDDIHWEQQRDEVKVTCCQMPILLCMVFQHSPISTAFGSILSSGRESLIQKCPCACISGSFRSVENVD